VRIGLAPAGSRDAATAVEMARHAEERGLAEFWLSEDYLERGAFAVAGGVAAATSDIQIGLGVINPWTRHVALTAMECAALDELSSGRLIIGVGASNARWMQGMLGIPFEKPIARLLDYVGALRQLLAGESVERDVVGLPVSAALSFSPTRPAIPIYLGVKGPIALERGAPVADGLMLSVLSSPPYVAWIKKTYSPRSLTAYVSVSCDDDPEEARARVRPRTAHFLGVHGPTKITEMAGMEPGVASLFHDRLAAGLDAQDLLTDEILDTFTVAGTIDHCVRGIRRFADAGLDSLIVMDDGSEDPHVVVEKAARVAHAASGACNR
jgi:5,10-methylenetetrahydromethanopterin reductase